MDVPPDNKSFAAQWNRTLGPTVGTLIADEVQGITECQRCYKRWRPSFVTDGHRVYVQPRWWQCPWGCNAGYPEDDAAKLDAVPPWAPPDDAPSVATALVWNHWRGIYLRIAVHDYDKQLLKCLRCSIVWIARWRRDGEHLDLGDWWRCPVGCNARLAERWPTHVRALTSPAPWDPPADLVDGLAPRGDPLTPTPVDQELDLRPAPGRSRTGRRSIKEQMLAEPGYRAKAQQARDLHENDRTLTWENIAKRVQLGTGATARRWVAALYDLEGQERGARKR